MKTCYTLRDSVPDSRAIADVCDAREIGLRGFLLTRIQVPLPERNKGRGTQLLQQVLKDADKEGAVMWLEIKPYGSLNYEQLRAWYSRRGFRESNYMGIMKRCPQKASHKPIK